MVEVKRSSQMLEGLVLRCRNRDDGERTVVRQRRVELRKLAAYIPHLSFRWLHPLSRALERRGRLLDRQAQLQGAAGVSLKALAGEGVHRHRLHGFRHLVYRIVFQQKKKSPGRIQAACRPQVFYQVRNEIGTVLRATFKDAARHGSHLPDLGLPAVRSVQSDLIESAEDENERRKCSA